MTSKQRILTAIRHEEPDRVPVSPFTWHLLRKWYGDVSWDLELRAGREHGFDPMPHLGMLDGPPFHNRLRMLNGAYTFEGRDYGEDLAHDVTVEVRIERLKEATVISRKIRTPAGILNDAIRQPVDQVHFTSPAPQTSGWGRAERLEGIVKGPEDLEKVRFLLTMPTPGQLSRIRRITELVGEEGLVAVDCLSPVDYLANEVMSMKDLLDTYRSNRPFFDALIELFWSHTFELARAYLEAGAEMVNGVWYSCGESDGWSIEAFREVFLPLIKNHVELAHEHGAIYEYNEEGKMKNLLPLLAEVGVDIAKTLTPGPNSMRARGRGGKGELPYTPRGDVDLAEAKREVGDRLCLRGHIDAIAVLEQGTPETIDEAVRSAMTVAGPGGGFIIGTDRPITIFTPEENVRAYFDACRRYGDYRHLGHER